jgi:hypothetical protein
VLKKILTAVLVLVLGWFTASTATTQFSRPQLAAPGGTCNLPPIPAPGETVTWTLAGSPYEICQNITIPSTSTVIVEAGVQINFDRDMQVIVSGTMQLQGQAAQRIVLQAPAVFPPIIDIDGGIFDASFSDFTGQVRVENGANVAISDCQFLVATAFFGRRSCRPRDRSFVLSVAHSSHHLRLSLTPSRFSKITYSTTPPAFFFAGSLT